MPGKKTEKIVRDAYPSSGDDSGIEGDTEEPKNKSNKRAASRSPSLSGDSSETESKSPNRAKKKQKALKTSKLSSSEDRSSSIFSSEHSSSDSSASGDSSEEKPKAKTKPSKTKTKAKKKRKKIGDESSDPDWSSSSNHLTRTEKENITHFVPQGELNEKGKYNLDDRLAAVNDNQGLLDKLDREAAITANIDIKAIDAKKSVEAEKTGFVEIRPEHDHSTGHGSNNQALIAEIQAGKIDKNTVIAIERKQYGENQGMKDIIKIANILEHNEKNPNSPINLPEKLENTLILQDALLYKAAKENGIKVISLEGRNLEHAKGTALYNENREQYMTDVISEIRSKGYNVIANVGSSHEANLKKALENQQKHDTGFSNIPRKLRPEALENNQRKSTGSSHIHKGVLQEALAIAKTIPAGMVKIKSVNQPKPQPLTIIQPREKGKKQGASI